MKPFRGQDMLDAIATALDRDRGAAGRRGGGQGTSGEVRQVSRRGEQQVMGLVAAGKMNKQVAGALGLSEVTVKIHRGSAMRKMRGAHARRSGADGRSARAFRYVRMIRCQVR